MKKLITFCLVLSVLFIALSSCDNEETLNVSGEPSGVVPSNTEARYVLILADGNEIDLNVQYVRTAYFYEEGNPFPTFVEVVSSKSEMEQYYQKHKNVFLEDAGNMMQDQDFLNAIAKYSDNYFTDNFLLIVGLTEGSGSVRHRVEIDENGEIVINRLLPEFGTDDMAAWSLIMELNKSFKVEQYQVKLVDIRD